MFDFNTLFKKVYAITDPTFDPNENFYTVLVNGAGEGEYYAEFDNQRRIHMGDSFYREFDPEKIDPAAFRTEIMSLDRVFAIKVNTAFLFLYDLSEKPFSSTYLQIVRDHMQPNDTLAVILLLPDDAAKTDEILASVGGELRENEMLYLYTKMAYRDRYLAEALCGTVLMHSSKKHYANLLREQKALLPKLNGALAGLPEVGAAAIKAKPSVYWSTLGCAFSNPKMDYLRSYVAAMCDKAQKLTTDDYYKICGELYTGMVADTNKGAAKSLLTEAVDRIPRIIKDEPKYEGYTLQDYFALLFGNDGYKTVEMSFKVTLAMMPNALNDNIVTNVANALFDRASAYHSDDLWREICAFLHEYREGLSRKYDEKRASVTSFAMQNEANDSFREDLETYIDNYIKYYEMQKHNDFWDSVETYVVNNRQMFDGACRKAKKLYDDLTQLQRELQFRKNVPVESEAVCRYPVSAILAAAVPGVDSGKICSEIEATYKEPARAEVGTDTVDMSYLTTLTSPPGFNSDMQYEMITGNGGYTAYVKQTLGKYLHFINIR